MAGTPYLGTFDGSTWTDQAKDLSGDSAISIESGGLVVSGDVLFVQLDETEATTGYLLEADSTLVGTYTLLDSGIPVKSLARDGGMVQV